MAAPAVATTGLTKHHGSIEDFVDLDLEVIRSQVFGFLGPNRAGKTTTIRSLLNHITPTPGSASVPGIDAVLDTAALVVAMLQAANGKVAGLLPNPVAHQDSRGIATRYLDALRDGIQRTLGAEPGSLTIVDTDLIGPWFED